MKKTDINTLLNILQTQGFKAYAVKLQEIYKNVNTSEASKKRINGKIRSMEPIFHCVIANKVDYDNEMRKITRLVNYLKIEKYNGKTT